MMDTTCLSSALYRAVVVVVIVVIVTVVVVCGIVNVAVVTGHFLVLHSKRRSGADCRKPVSSPVYGGGILEG